LEPAINRVPLKSFLSRVVFEAIRAFPQFESVAKCSVLIVIFLNND